MRGQPIRVSRRAAAGSLVVALCVGGAFGATATAIGGRRPSVVVAQAAAPAAPTAAEPAPLATSFAPIVERALPAAANVPNAAAFDRAVREAGTTPVLLLR